MIGQSRIKNPVKHLPWTFFGKNDNGFWPLTTFVEKAPSQIFVRVLNIHLFENILEIHS